MPHLMRARRHRFWLFHPLGRALQLAAASFVGGAGTGAGIGYSNSFSNPPGVGPSVAQWVGFTLLANGLLSLALGLLISLLIFVLFGTVESRWSARRRWRFARALPLQMYLPVLLSLLLSPVLAAPWLLAARRSGGDAGDVLGRANWIVTFAAMLLFIWIPAFSSRRARRRRLRTGSRLLPVD